MWYGESLIITRRVSQLANLKHAEEGRELVLGDRHVNMSNALIRSAQGLSLVEKRVMAATVAKLDSVRMWTPEKMRVRLTATEYAEAFDVDPTSAYEQLKGAAEKLFHRYARWEEPGKRGPIVTKVHWVGSIKYHEGEGWIELCFHHEIAPHLFMLRSKFTSYKLSQATALRSLYSWRLLELLMQFKNKGELHITIEDFAGAMEAPETYRANFAQLRRFVVEPAIKELTTKDGMIITWEPTKKGRRVAALHFKFKQDPQAKLDL